MYCKKCHTLVPDGEVICHKCGYDNSLQTDVLEETKEIQLNPKMAKRKEKKLHLKKGFIVIGILLIIALVSFYIINDSKSLEESIPDNTSTNEDANLNYDTEFSLENLRINYPSNSFGASKSTIFYKNNNAYNIEIKTISLDEYNNIISKDEINNSNIGSIVTKAYAEESKYHHIFTDETNYYIITVNFVLEETLESTKIQLELSQILNSSYISEYPSGYEYE